MDEKLKTKAKNRPTRKRLQKNTILNFQGLDKKNYEYRLVNDEDGRIDAFQAASWTPVLESELGFEDDRIQDSTKIGSVVRRVVNKGISAVSKQAVLMKIKKEFFEEDQKAKTAEIDKNMEGLHPDANTDKNVYGYLKTGQ